MNFHKYETNGPLDTWLFLPLANRLAPLLHACGLTPNDVTTLSSVAGLFAVLCFWRDEPLAAVLSFTLYYVLDCADGIIARTFRLTSDFGEVYDYMKDTALFVIYSMVIVMKLGAWMAPISAFFGIYLMAWEGVMACRACYQRHGHYDFYSEKVRRKLFRPYLAMMFLCYRIGRPVVNWPLHWFGTGEFVAVALVLQCIPGEAARHFVLSRVALWS